MRHEIKPELYKQARRHLVLFLGLPLFVLAACGGALGQGPTEAEIRAAFDQKRQADLALLAESELALPPEGLSIASVEAADCRDDGDGEFHCPARLAELKDGRRLSEDHVLVLEQTEAGWRLKFVE